MAWRLLLLLHPRKCDLLMSFFGHCGLPSFLMLQSEVAGGTRAKRGKINLLPVTTAPYLRAPPVARRPEQPRDLPLEMFAKISRLILFPSLLKGQPSLPSLLTYLVHGPKKDTSYLRALSASASSVLSSSSSVPRVSFVHETLPRPWLAERQCRDGALAL